MLPATRMRQNELFTPVVDLPILAEVVRDNTYDARAALCVRLHEQRRAALCVRLFMSSEELRVILFMHARPSRSYREPFLHKKLGIRCTTALRRLTALGLVAEVGEAYCYAVEHPTLLAMMDELSLRYHAALALMGFFRALSPHFVPLSRPRSAYGGVVAKPKQLGDHAARTLA